MSREIKFRAWDSARKKMHTSAKWVEFRFDGEGKLKAVNYHPNGDEQRLPVMQFTGLRDANGVEIYEGDLVCIRDYCDNEFLMSGVVKFGVRGYPAFDIYNERNETYSDEYNTLTNDDDLKFEVFGNIYEHPHLLDGGK